MAFATLAGAARAAAQGGRRPRLAVLQDRDQAQEEAADKRDYKSECEG